MSLTRVAAKLLGYAELARSTGVITPVLLWVPTTARETAARHTLRATAASLPDPDAVPVATAAADLLATTADPSPGDRVWLPLDSARAHRIHLHDLATVWPRRTPPPPNTDTDTDVDSDAEQSATLLGGLVMLPAPEPMFGTGR
jgi:hypothetical protein